MVVNHTGNIFSRDVPINMIRVLAKQRNGIKMVHINAQSLNNKIDEFRLTFENSGIDIVCVSETWLNETTPDSLIMLRDYRVYRADRKTHAGGVAIFVKCGIKCKFLTKGGSGDLVEHLFLEISMGESKLLVGCVYRPSRLISFEGFTTKLEAIGVEYEDAIIVGDFNSNLLRESKFSDCMYALGLSPTNSTIPTHYTTGNNSLLDIFFVSDISKVQLYDQIGASCFSKHDLIFLAYDFRVVAERDEVYYRDFRNLNYADLEEKVSRIDWWMISGMISVDEQVSFMENNIGNLYDATLPLKRKIVSSQSRPWFNSEIRNLIRRRDLAHSRWKRFKSSIFKEEFKVARRQVNKSIEKAKREYFSKRFGDCIDSKKTWNVIREIGIGGNHDSHDFQVGANELNQTFTNISMVTPDETFYRDIFEDQSHVYGEFDFSCVSQSDVLSGCLSIRSNATGHDEINPRFVKLLLPYILPFLTYMLNTIIMTRQFPSRWKHARIIPLPKTRYEYRPIAILPYFSKVLEKLMHTQINSYLASNDLLTSQQSGFRVKHSCTTALIDVAEDIRRDIDSGHCDILVLLDHSKAFDTVDHNLLISKLKHFFNFSNTSSQLIRSYLGNRSQSVYLKNEVSDALPVVRGVPQGSILGPLLFSCYSNDLPHNLMHCKIHMYADDVQLYLGTRACSLDEVVSRINTDLENVQVWASANGLCLNPSKSKCLVIHKRTSGRIPEIDVRLNGQRIEVVKRIRNLGIVFNSTLTWSDHVNYLVGSVYNRLRTLWSTQAYTPQRIRMLLAKTFLMPSLLYGCEIFACCDSISGTKLNRLFNNICRYVYGLGRYDHISFYTQMLYGVSLENLFRIKSLILLHKIIYLRLPPYLFFRIDFARSNRGRQLIPLRYRTLVSEWQFYINSIRLWNTLPHSIQTTSNAAAFQKLVYSLFSQSS